MMLPQALRRRAATLRMGSLSIRSGAVGRFKSTVTAHRDHGLLRERELARLEALDGAPLSVVERSRAFNGPQPVYAEGNDLWHGIS